MEIHKVTRGQNVTCDQYKSTREVIKDIRNKREARIDKLTSQGLILKAIKEHSDKNTTNYWHKALSTLPSNIYSYVIRYMNNTTREQYQLDEMR